MSRKQDLDTKHLAALWARVDELGELIACFNDEFHPPNGVEEFDALRAVLRIFDPAQSAALDSLLGPDN
jgi:hypothetical protein